MSEDAPLRPIVSIRPRAASDIEKQADWLEKNAAPDVARHFRAAIMEAVESIGAMPGAGAPREVQNPRLSGLRMWIVPGFRNYLLFYLTPNGGVEIIRLFHGAQDVTTLLEGEE